MSTTIESVVRDIEERIALLTQELDEKRQEFRRQTEEAEKELRRLNQAHAELTGQAPPAQQRRQSNGGAPRAPRRPRGELRQSILAIVGERPGVSAGEVAQVVGGSKNSVATALSKLASEGEVERVQHGGRSVGFKLPG